MQAMFQTIGEMSPEAGHKELRTFTVCVGRRATPADFYVSDVKVSEVKTDFSYLVEERREEKGREGQNKNKEMKRRDEKWKTDS